MQPFDKIVRAIEARQSASVKIGPHKLNLYAASTRDRFTLSWYHGLKRERWESTCPEATKEKAQEILKHFESGFELAKRVSDDRIQQLVEADTALSGVNIEELVKFYKEHMAARNVSVAKITELYEQAGVLAGLSVRQRDTRKNHLKQFGKVFNTSLQAIRASDIDAFLATIPNLKTRKNVRITICALFKFAQRKGFLPHGLTEADKTEQPKIMPKEATTISAQQISLMLENCKDPLLKNFLLIGAFSGCRSSEIQRLKWGDLRDDCIVLTPDITKTNRRRIAEIPENLRAWLQPVRGNPDSFVTYPESLDHKLYRRARRLCKNLEIEWVPNALRHTFVSCHLELHRDPPRTAKTSGHSLAVLENSYLKLTPREEAEAWFDILPEPKTDKP